MKGLELYQKINHFPGMYNVYRKNHLTNNLEKMRKAFSEHYSFYPKTYILPNDIQDLMTAIKNSNNENKKVFIAKPCDQSQGRGIFIITDIQDIPIKDKIVVQHYINR